MALQNITCVWYTEISAAMQSKLWWLVPGPWRIDRSLVATLGHTRIGSAHHFHYHTSGSGGSGEHWNLDLGKWPCLRLCFGGKQASSVCRSDHRRRHHHHPLTKGSLRLFLPTTPFLSSRARHHPPTPLLAPPAAIPQNSSPISRGERLPLVPMTEFACRGRAAADQDGGRSSDPPLLHGT